MSDGTGSAAADASNESTEEPGERLDRELNELLQELRVLLPGTTVLFGFFLASTFSKGFEQTTDAERGLFIAAFLTTAACAVLLIAPGVRHRMRFRECDKEALIASANRVMLAGAVLLALSLAAVSALIVEHLYGWTTGIAAGFGVFVLSVWFWFGWAMLRELDEHRPRRAARPVTFRESAPRDSPPAARALAGTRAAGGGHAPDR